LLADFHQIWHVASAVDAEERGLKLSTSQMLLWTSETQYNIL